MKTICMYISLLFLIGCTSPEHATKILRQEGYSDITMTGYDWFACSDDDVYHTGFIAKKNGNIIRGAICSGLIFKNSTIRYK